METRNARGAFAWGRSIGPLLLLATAVVLALVPERDVPVGPIEVGDDCPTTLQALIDGTPAGGSLTVPPCIYRETVTITKPLTIHGSGAIIDGRDADGTVVRSMWMTVAANDVVVDGLTMRHAANAPQTGALRIADGVSNVTVRDCDLSWADGAAVAYGGANDSTVTGCSIHENGQLGVHLGRDLPGTSHGWRNSLVGNRIFANRKPAVDIGEDGGMKATLQHHLVVRDNEVYGNEGPGIWLDVDNVDSVVTGNRVRDNGGPGIMFETSDGADIAGNAVWDNGWDDAVWGWGAGILVSSSRNADVHDNIVAWNYAGISVISQDRPDSPGATGNHVHDNAIVQDAPGEGVGQYALFWADDGAGTLYAASGGNRGADNRYWYPVPEDRFWRFVWDGGLPALADFNGTPGEQDGRYLSNAEKDTILRAAGMPTSS